MRKKPRVIDAEFTVVEPPLRERVAWYRRLYEDYPGLVFVVGLALMAAVPALKAALSAG